MEGSNTRNALFTENPVKLMISLSIPAILGMLIIGLYNFMDSHGEPSSNGFDSFYY